LRLSPFDPLNYLAYNALAISHFYLGQYELSRDAARKSVQSNERFGMSHAFLAGALVRLGFVEEAKASCRQAVQHDPNFSIRSFTEAVGLEPTVIEPFAQAWREAGLPLG
jgi:tetratricopeptide (TPR) repeat protein